MIKIIKSGRFRWVHINKVDENTINRIKKLFKFHHLDIEDVRADIHDPKLDSYKKYLFAIFNLPLFNKNSLYIKPEELDVFVGKNYIVTIHNGGLKELDNLFKKIENNFNLRSENLGRGVDYLLFMLLQDLFRLRMKSVADNISSKLNKVEERVYSHTGRQNIQELAALRRNVLLFRRMVDPQREIITSLSMDKKDFINDIYQPYFDDVRDYLNRIWTRLSNYKDIIDGLYETNESLISHRTNEIIKALTIISVAIMPMTLLSSIYGMNIKLPFQNTSSFVWSMFGLIFAITMIAIFVMKRKKWF